MSCVTRLPLLTSFHDTSDRPHHKFNVQFLRDRKKQNEFNCEVKNRFATLEGLLEETVSNHWTGLQETWKNAFTHVLGKKGKQHKEWLTLGTWQKIEKRKELKQKINQCQDQQEKDELRAKYWEINKEVKKSARDDKIETVRTQDGRRGRTSSFEK
ncbi:hypothetical protein C0Q70_00779 [Pomacea canaliculata]|uniref:Uncharacterized protein n=1 Tax=Pomacea canaliculata TaxID=400727 RepID=A0A2T7PXN8_POMCA|nr:hypothetical protein C0Q70_00779 [Pomacea canaliculata]